MSNFDNDLSAFVYMRTYSRWDNENQRREEWSETVDRFVEWAFRGRDNLPKELKEQVREALFNRQVMPSMRALWSAGASADRENVGIYNCSFLPIDCVRSFSEGLYILMQGTGVGYSVEKKFVENLPEVAPEKEDDTALHITVMDSTEGWASAFDTAITHVWQGGCVEMDVSGVRPKGAILKTKGGRSSGPEPFLKAVHFAVDTLKGARGRKLTTLECHDIMCQIAEVVVVGGVRRAAMISFSDPEDELLRHAKNWKRGSFPSIRYMANNSAYYPERPSEEVFWAEWNALAESGSGERGFSIDNWWRNADRPKGMTRSNPCVTGDTRVMTDRGLIQIKDFLAEPLSLKIDTRFGTDGDGRTSDKGAFITGEKQVYRLTTRQGYSLKLTGDHRVMTSKGWVEAQHLEEGDKIHISNNGGAFGSKGSEALGALAGWYAADGTVADNAPRLYFYHGDRALVGKFQQYAESVTGSPVSVATYEATQRDSFQSAALRDYLSVENRCEIPSFVWEGTEDCQKAYLSALFTGDGCVLGNPSKGASVRLHSVDLEHLQGVQQLLLNFNIFSKIYSGRMKDGIRMLPDGLGGHKGYFCKESHELVISRRGMVDFHHRIGFIREDKQEKLGEIIQSYSKGPYSDKFVADFLSLEPLGVETVYDLTEETTHSFIANGVVVHNCHEIGLRYTPSQDPWTGEGGAGQFCNLSAAIMRAEDNLESMCEKIRLATWIGVIQSSYTDFGYLRKGWSELCQEDRLLGVDITGQCDNPELSTDWKAMTIFNEVARETALEASKTLGINYPAAITCGKPSGNSSQFVDCASGFHPRYAKFYFRHVRLSGADPLCQLLQSQNIPLFKENGQEDLPDDKVDTWVARFPVKAPEGCMTRDDEDALMQMERYLGIMRSWCSVKGHNQSATIYVRDGEWEKVGQWLWDNFDEVVGLSFLPYDGGAYRLAPYVEITEEEYLKTIAEQPRIDFSKLVDFEKTDMGEGAQERACFAGECEV